MLATARLISLATGTDSVRAPGPVVGGKINPDRLDKGWRFKVAYMITHVCASV
jgi:hypothetical protein